MLDIATSAGQWIFDPRGVVSVESQPLSERRTSLVGLRLGILNNSKWDANKLSRCAAAALGAKTELVVVNYYVKKTWVLNHASVEMTEEIARCNDIVLTAIGDCGSCCSCCIRNTVALEGLGIPTALIITTEYVNETHLTRAAIEMRELRPVVIGRTVSSITKEEAAQRVAVIQVQAREVWLGMRLGIETRGLTYPMG
ncbi:MAG: hypothetical protein OSB69_00835 [Alphaproteobacteria bacterium]|nr:hypothetical protein [Alphaproteobacteria bacterium]